MWHSNFGQTKQKIHSKVGLKAATVICIALENGVGCNLMHLSARPEHGLAHCSFPNQQQVHPHTVPLVMWFSSLLDATGIRLCSLELQNIQGISHQSWPISNGFNLGPVHATANIVEWWRRHASPSVPHMCSDLRSSHSAVSAQPAAPVCGEQRHW